MPRLSCTLKRHTGNRNAIHSLVDGDFIQCALPKLRAFKSSLQPFIISVVADCASDLFKRWLYGCVDPAHRRFDTLVGLCRP